MENFILDILHKNHGKKKSNVIFSLLLEQAENRLQAQKDFNDALDNLIFKKLIKREGNFIHLTELGRNIKSLEELDLHQTQERKREKQKETYDKVSFWGEIISSAVAVISLIFSVYSMYKNNKETAELKEELRKINEKVKILEQNFKANQSK